VSFAFDSLTEAEVARIKRHFGDKQIHDLIFDETPYKVWSAKVTGTATIKYIPFDEGSTHRLYKGEGTIQFTCYYPFARCWSANKDDYYTHPAYRVKKENGYKSKAELTDQEKNKIASSIEEWIGASNIMQGGNFGDLDVPFTFVAEGEQGELSIGEKIKISWKDLPQEAIVDEELGEPVKIRILLDTKAGLAMVQYQKNEKWYFTPKFIFNGCFTGDLNAKIPVGTDKADIPEGVEFTALYF
jgi:hypothetical protein